MAADGKWRGRWQGLRKSLAALCALAMLLIAYAAPQHLAHDPGAQGPGAHPGTQAAGVHASAQTVLCHADQRGHQPVTPAPGQGRTQGQGCCDFCTLSVAPGLALAYIVALLHWPSPAERLTPPRDAISFPPLAFRQARSRAPPASPV